MQKVVDWTYRLPKGISKLTLSPYSYGLAILLFFFLRPYPQAFLGAMAMRLFDMVILALPIFFFLFNKTKEQLNPQIAGVFIFFFLIFMFGLYSLVNGFLLNVTRFNFRDPLDVIRYLQLPVFSIFGYYLALHKDFEAKHVLRLFALIIIIIGIFAVMQKLIPAHFGFITNLYAPEHQSNKVSTTERVTTLFGNPNTTALMTCLFCSFLFGGILVKGIFRPISIAVLLSVCVLTILLSGSRTGFIAFGFLGVVYLFLRTKNKLLFFLLIIGALFGVWLSRELILEIIKYFNYYLYVGIRIVLNLDFETLLAAGNTFSQRFEIWSTAISLFKQSPIFGLGPLRGVAYSSTDNYYIYLLLRNGIVGLSIYLSFIIYAISVANRATRCRSTAAKMFGYAFIFQTSVVLLMNFLIEAQIQNSVVYLHLTSLGIVIGLTKLERSHEKNL